MREGVDLLSMKAAESRIRKSLDRACDEAYEAVKAEATRIMRTHKRFRTFIMAMGTACFYDKDGPVMNESRYTKRLFDFLYGVGVEVKVLGEPMRLDRDGDAITFTREW